MPGIRGVGRGAHALTGALSRGRRQQRGAPAGASPNRNTEVRSPNVCRRHAEMFGSTTPVTRSSSRSVEVWSNGSEDTQPPAVHGETMIAGTRNPAPTCSPLPGFRPASSS